MRIIASTGAMGSPLVVEIVVLSLRRVFPISPSIVPRVAFALFGRITACAADSTALMDSLYARATSGLRPYAACHADETGAVVVSSGNGPDAADPATGPAAASVIV
ncbi:hypothetical protein [Streptomyces sp. CB00455]|uniref:hypothetical protein n=1 Tax=Streptomyces sp. CB00455 TaxID=1703927 RepID=UPI0018FF06A1|nr:hypothetical protein [Streptomyces sp. CB00455]